VKLRSLHARLIAGTIVWVVGVLVTAFIVGFVFLHLHPGSALLIHNSFLIVIGVVLVTAGVSVIRRGLSPFATLRDQLQDVRAGRISRLDGEYPTEVEPLVNELNMLLEDRERRVARAVAKAGDLAHGLKTPLAILTQEIDRATAAGQAALAATLREQVDRMRRQIDSHLAQARATAGGTMGARADVRAAVSALVRAMERLYADRRLTFRTADVAAVAARAPQEDLEEMLGNLLDNACKWASSQVVLVARAEGDRVAIDVDDDGAGLNPVMRERVLQRGVRADETAPGSGLGLAIVRDLAEAYGGTIALEPSPLGGLRVRLQLPRQDVQ
jgi:signal transduction histidine kinase